MSRRVVWNGLSVVEYGERLRGMLRGDRIRSCTGCTCFERTGSFHLSASALADSGVNVVVRVWVKSSDYWGVYF